jgi:hypothetical protein
MAWFVTSVRGLQADKKGARHQAGVELAHDSIGQSLFVANGIHEAGGEPTGAQDIVHDCDGIVVGIGPANARVPQGRSSTASDPSR